MCGIVGVISSEINTTSHPYLSFFKQALFADTFRGFDSTGLFCVDYDAKEPEVWKKAFPGPDFLQLEYTKSLLSDHNDYYCVIGHNRAATKGKINHATAHPFQIGDITLVHNGTIRNHMTLKGGNKFTVDSEAICNALNESPVEDVISSLDGAFTLIWYDKSTGGISFIRNKERPLAFGRVKDRDTILLASEAGMLKWLASRNKLELVSIAEPKPGELFTFYPEKGKDWIKNHSFKSIKVKESMISLTNYTYYDDDDYSNYKGVNGYYHKGRWVQHNKSTSTSTSQQQRLPNPNAILSKYKLAVDEMVVMLDPKFIAYNNDKKRGCIEGRLEGVDGAYRSYLHGVDYDDYLNNILGHNIIGVISSAVDDGTIDKIHLRYNEFTAIDKEPIEDTDKEPRFQGPDKSKTYSEKEFQSLTSKGCAYCTGNVSTKEHKVIGWTKDNQPICPDCIEYDDVKRLLN